MPPQAHQGFASWPPVARVQETPLYGLLWRILRIVVTKAAVTTFRRFRVLREAQWNGNNCEMLPALTQTGYSAKCRVATVIATTSLALAGSGRIVARTGLRMMPTFPRSPLTFRKASFPRYG